GLTPITLHHVAATHTKLADFVGAQLAAGLVLDADLHVGNGQADGARLARAVQRVLRHHRTGLAQPVTFDERDVELFLKLLEYLRRQGRRAADAEAQRQRHVNRRADQAAVKLRNRRQNRDLALQNLL